MKIDLKKTIRPTQLQPKLYSVVKDLSKNCDYKVIVNKNNEPLCVITSYALFKEVDLNKCQKKSDQILINQMQEYYSSFSEEEKMLLNETTDDDIA